MSVLWHIATAVVLRLAILRHSVEASTVKEHETIKTSKVLLLSIGGFRDDYMTNINLTTINEMVANGTKAKYVQNSVNVLDIVDHYSIVTGLYPESHGIISNIMFDPELKLVFSSKTREQPEWWENVHPIWHEIVRQGRGLSALCRWPGVYGPMKSTLHCEAGERHSLKDDIDQAIQWLKNGVKLVLLYSDDIKQAALKWGPYSQQTIDKVKNFDSIMDYLLDKTYNRNLTILLTSDSGVTDLHWEHLVDLDQCINPNSYVLIQPQATLLIYPKHGHSVQELYQNLTRCKHVKPYLKEDLPERFHFSNHRRIPPIVAFVPLGAVVRSSKRAHQKINEVLNGLQGDHMGGTGYHPGYKEMRGVFIGYGPTFQPGMKFQAIKNVDIYGFICHILGIQPRPNNGSRDVIASMFSDMMSLAADVNTTENSQPQPIRIDSDVRTLFWVLVVTTALLILFCCVGCITTMHDNYRRGYKCNTKIEEPGAEKLLGTDSSDEE